MPKPISRIFGAATEYRRQIVRCRHVGHADLGHHAFVVTQLGIRNTPLAQHKAADVTV